MLKLKFANDHRNVGDEVLRNHFMAEFVHDTHSDEAVGFGFVPRIDRDNNRYAEFHSFESDCSNSHIISAEQLRLLKAEIDALVAWVEKGNK